MWLLASQVCEGCDHVFSLAADMGGMGFIQSNHGVIFYNNTMVTFNMMEAARQAGAKRWVPCICAPCSLLQLVSCTMRQVFLCVISLYLP